MQNFNCTELSLFHLAIKFSNLAIKKLAEKQVS